MYDIVRGYFSKEKYKIARFSDESPTGKVIRVPQEGGGMPEYRKLWLEKYEPLIEKWTAYSSRRNTGDKGVFKIEDYEVRLKQKNSFFNPDKPEGFDNKKFVDKLAMTFGLYDLDEKVMTASTSNKPFAIEYNINYPNPNVSWENFKKTGLFKFVGKLGFHIQEDPPSIDYDCLIGLYAMFDVKVVPSRTNADLKFGNVVPETITTVSLTDKQLDSNEELLKKMFS